MKMRMMIFSSSTIYFHLVYILHVAFYQELLLVPSKILLKGSDVASLCSGSPFVAEGVNHGLEVEPGQLGV